MKKRLKEEKLTDVEKLHVELDKRELWRKQRRSRSDTGQLLGHIKTDVNLDSAAFEAHAAEVEVVKELLGRDITSM